MAIALVALALAMTRTEVDVSRHVLAFALGALLGRSGHVVGAMVVGVALALLGIVLDPQVFYGGAGLLLTVVFGRGLGPEPSFMRRLAAYSYEYFLVHGICIVAVGRVVHSPVVLSTVAVMASCVGAVLLLRVRIYLGKVSGFW